MDRQDKLGAEEFEDRLLHRLGHVSACRIGNLRQHAGDIAPVEVTHPPAREGGFVD
jgi:hypothetical protein